MPTDRTEAKLPVAITCECAVSYHVEKRRDGRWVAVLDQELPDIMTMCVGRCERCGLPFHDGFPHDGS